ncbi:LysR family transcriptional regulator [Nocardia concava]|uniref:LysR family transcriptional regulator n=1 Tax=Nocardia concava TaxID=257281 RepID=UPI001C3F3AEB|nr:LysR family transcriptional regulator [Nocardia concava]
MDLRVLRYFVAVAEERHVGRAANRLHMTQPPLSRAIRELEDEFGVILFERTPKGVVLTPAGAAMYDEASELLKRADRIRGRVTAAGSGTLTIGTLADTAAHIGGRLVALFRARHPHVDVSVHEADLGDPTAGLRAGLVDVALTRTPFDDNGISMRVLRSVPAGVVLRDDDPLAHHPSVSSVDLIGRRWVRLPSGADPVWTAYWTPARTPRQHRRCGRSRNACRRSCGTEHRRSPRSTSHYSPASSPFRSPIAHRATSSSRG